MVSKKDSNKARQKRHLRVRNKISGTAERPRLSVYRSLKNMYIQLIDDTKGVTLVAASTKELEGSNGGNKGAAFEVGKLIGTKAIEKGIKELKQVVDSFSKTGINLDGFNDTLVSVKTSLDSIDKSLEKITSKSKLLFSGCSNFNDNNAIKIALMNIIA